MFNLTHTFPVLSLLCLFMATESFLEAHGTIARCVRVEYPYVEKCILGSIPKASCSDVQTCTIFLLADCKGGSVATLWHTSVNREAVMSRISLCRIVGSLLCGRSWHDQWRIIIPLFSYNVNVSLRFNVSRVQGIYVFSNCC